MPSLATEHDRQLQREWETVREDAKRSRNRIQGLLATQGVTLPLTAQFLSRLRAAQRWDGSELAAPLVARLAREWAALGDITARPRALERARRARVHTATDVVATQTKRLTQVRGMAYEWGVDADDRARWVAGVSEWP